VLAPAVMVRSRCRSPVQESFAGEKLTVVPAGAPEADRVMELSKPPLMIVLTVDVPTFPCAMLREVGDGERLKLGGARHLGYSQKGDGGEISGSVVGSDCHRQSRALQRQQLRDVARRPRSCRPFVALRIVKKSWLIVPPATLALFVPTTTVRRVPVSVTFAEVIARPRCSRPVVPSGVVEVAQFC
jgi:hypothetical protein